MAGSTAEPGAGTNTVRGLGVLAGVVAGPFFLASVGLNTWASLDYFHSLGLEFVGGFEAPWPSSLARGPYAWAQIATFIITGLLLVVFAASLREGLPRRRASTVAAALVGLLGVAVVFAAFRVDVPMLSGGAPGTWNGWVHAVAYLLIIATGVLAPLTMVLALRGAADWRPMAVVSLIVAVLFVVLRFLPWGNISFLLGVVTLFAWIALLAARLRRLIQPVNR